MFRDLKEYQDITKLYVDKVSKTENLEERKGSSIEQQAAAREAGAQRMKTLGNRIMTGNKEGIKRTPTNTGGRVKNKVKYNPGKPTPSSQIRKIDPAPFNKRGKAPEVKQTSSPTSSQTSSAPVVSDKTKQGKPRTKAQMMAAKRIASGKTIADVKKDNTDAMKARAKAKFEAFKKRREEKKAAKPQDDKLAQKKASEAPQAKPAATPSGDKLKAGSFGISEKGKQQAAANRAEVAKKKESSNTSSMNIASTKNKSKFSENPRVQAFNKKKQDLKTTAKYGSTATIQTQDGKEFKPGDPGYKEQLNKARNVVKKSMQKNSYEPDMDAYDMVLEYLLSTEQVATIEEANYVMTEMDAETIQGIVEEQKKNFDEGAGVAAAALAGGLLTYGLYKRNQYKKDAEKRDEKTNFGKIQKATDAKNKMLRDAGMGGN